MGINDDLWEFYGRFYGDLLLESCDPAGFTGEPGKLWGLQHK
jgi:hypothetical protein